jgi:ribosomal-protein-alanine N-acetyltransferase
LKTTPVKLRIRRMTLEDVLRVVEIDQSSFSLPWSERSFRFEISENPASRPWVAEIMGDDGQPRIVGMMVIWLVLDEAHVSTIAVDSTCRRQGVARRLLAEGLLSAWQDGARQALLEVRRGNMAARLMYEQFGFLVVGVRPRYYQDNGEDAMLMNLQPIVPQVLQALVE